MAKLYLDFIKSEIKVHLSDSKMSPKLQLYFILAALFFTGIHSRGHRPCIEPADGPEMGTPPPVCQGPCKCVAENCPGGLVTCVCGCRCYLCAKQEGKDVKKKI